MKPIILFLLGLFLQTSFAQTNSIDIFRGQVISNPERYGNGIFTHIIRGNNLMVAGKFEEAILSYDNAIAQDPYFAEAYVKRAMAKYKLGWNARAQQDYEYAMRLNPYAADLYGYKNAYRKLNILAFESRELIYKPDLQDRLRHYFYLFPSVFKYITNDQEWYDLIYHIEEKIKVNNKKKDFLIQKALAWMMLNDWNAALAALEDAIAIQPTALAFDLKGLIYTELNDFEQAKTMHQTAITLDSTYAFGYYNMSLLKLSEQKLTEAWSYANRAIELDKDAPKTYFQRAALAKALGENEIALNDYNTLLEMDEAYKTEVLLNRAIFRKLSGDILGALEDLNQAIRHERNEVELYFARGNVNILMENYYEALNDFNKTIELDGAFAKAYYNRGITYLLLYNRPDGCYDLEKAVELGYHEGAAKLQSFCGF